MRSTRLSVAVCGALLCSFVLAAPAGAAVFVVNNNGDTGDATPGDDICATAGAVCTLRAAIEDANATPATGDFINFQTGLVGPITIGSTLAVTAPVSINGNGSGVAATDTVVDGNDTFRLLSITSAGTPTFGISNMRFQDGGLDDPVGAGGAGILTSENTTLTNVFVTSNQITGDGDSFGAGIASTAGTLALSQGTTVSGNSITLDTGTARGGGVDAAGPLSVSASTVSGNSVASPTAPSGGGLASAAALTLTNSTVSGNSTDGAGTGGGLSATGVGTRSVVNSTISTNAAGSGGGGGAAFAGNASVTNSTFALNTDAVPMGGGLDLRASGLLTTVTVKNTIIGSNSAAAACSAQLGSFIQSASQGYNIDAGSSCGFGATGGNQQNSDPLLAPLADYGGGTQTHALNAGSPALDAADPANLCGAGIAFDQRFVSRPQAARCDIGALEVQARLLSAGVRGSGRGTIFSNPSGITCPNDCAERLLPGSIVTLTALADSSSTFGGWSGCDSVSGNQCTVALGTFAAGQDRGVNATFTAIPGPPPDNSVPKPGSQAKKKKCRKGKKRKGTKCVKKKKKKKKKGR